MRRIFWAMLGAGLSASLWVADRPASAEALGRTGVEMAAAGDPAPRSGGQRPRRAKPSSERPAKVVPVPPDEPWREEITLAAAPLPPLRPPPAGRLLNADSVLVIKSERRLYLLNGGRTIRAYDVALGFNPVGHKLQEGDGRTPEGVYTLGEPLPESRFYRALPISYPAPDDVERARALGLRPGGRIMIHGLPPSGARMGRQHLYLDWTDGCVAVTNEEIDEIAQAVRPGTPIEIRP